MLSPPFLCHIVFFLLLEVGIHQSHFHSISKFRHHLSFQMYTKPAHHLLINPCAFHQHAHSSLLQSTFSPRWEYSLALDLTHYRISISLQSPGQLVAHNHCQHSCHHTISFTLIILSDTLTYRYSSPNQWVRMIYIYILYICLFIHLFLKS